MRKSNSKLFVQIGILGLVFLLLFLPVSAQSQQSAVPAVLPSDPALDVMMEARDWKGLGAALSLPRDSETFLRATNWLRTRVDAGGGLMLNLLYARNLWMIGDQQKNDDPGKDARLTAGAIMLYAYELILIDGTKCDDRSAPGNRINQLFMGQAATLAFLKKQTADMKLKIVDLVIAGEKKTAPLRKDDDLICRDGLDQMRAGIERGKQHEISAPGQVGKTVAVEPPSDWAPKFVSPEVYKPMQDKARSEMRAGLLKILE